MADGSVTKVSGFSSFTFEAVAENIFREEKTGPELGVLALGVLR